MILFYDFEVTRYDWLVVLIDPAKEEIKPIVNDREELQRYFDTHAQYIWAGYNSRHYDQYILKGILCGFDPYDINEWIITKGMEGWQYSPLLKDVRFINYDIMPNPPVSLKALEGFMGSDIRETETNFRINRSLTDDEISKMVSYCTHDVEQTMEVFMRRQSEFQAMLGIVKAFDLPLECIGYTEARITATVLGCRMSTYHDELDYYFLPCLRLKKYRFVQDWFDRVRKGAKPTKAFYKQHLDCVVAGIPHTFGFGGLHGAADHPVHYKGSIWHVDVNNYYPSMLIAHNIVTRSATNDNYTLVYNTRKELKMKQLQAAADGNKALAKSYKSQQLPYKKLLNSLSGAMKAGTDGVGTNPAYDPRNNNTMCINGQLMLLDLIEHLEVIKGFTLIQSNTDGLIVQIPDTDEAFDQMDDICYEWESRCSTDLCEIGLATDAVEEIWQKDVNNYLWIEADGSTECKGAYVKDLSDLDYDLPIVNKAMKAYLIDHTPVEDYIYGCDDLREFQKIVKLSDAYEYVEHECGNYESRQRGRHVVWSYSHRDRYTYKTYRVFASLDLHDGRILKCRNGKADKFGNTPEHCFIVNDDVTKMKVPDKLDHDYYVELTEKRLQDFGIERR